MISILFVIEKKRNISHIFTMLDWALIVPFNNIKIQKLDFLTKAISKFAFSFL